MNIKIESKASGKLLWLRVFDKNGGLKHVVKDVPNIILNGGMSDAVLFNTPGVAYAMTSTAESFEDLGGTWNQTGNTVTRATGSATFPASPTQIGQELRWNTGERCHVTARASDTSITVSGPARTITGGTLRRFDVNGSNPASSSSGATQTSGGGTILVETWNDTTGVYYATRQFNFTSAVASYTLGSIIVANHARIKLPAPIVIDIDDQIQCVYAMTETVVGRARDYELGAESVGVPEKHSMVSIVGNGTSVDVTFSAATHFLAGDKLDLRNVVPKRFAISSASSTSTTFTVNTTLAHGLLVGDTVLIENASVAGYNGTHVVATVPDSDTVTITNAANPGAMGAFGTVRLATPATYFDDLGLATIASMVSTSVARITSAITGPAADPGLINGDPGVKYRARRTGATARFQLLINTANLQVEANAQAIADITTTGTLPSGSSPLVATPVVTSAGFANDWQQSYLTTWNSGGGSGRNRVKQFLFTYSFGNQGVTVQITLNTPFTKTDAQRLTLFVSKKLLRDLP